jgi:hypothetical protein
MPRVTCRCGEKLKVPATGPERIDCPKCGARIRLRRPAQSLQGMSETDDGYLRFHCPCGRRLKVTAVGRPEAGKCPDCGRVVPVPESAWSALPAAPGVRSARSDPNARTQDMDADELARLERWTARHLSHSRQPSGESSTGLLPTVPGADGGSIMSNTPPPSVVKFEAGLRICPRCRKPVHLGAAACRECGTPVPRQ